MYEKISNLKVLDSIFVHLFTGIEHITDHRCIRVCRNEWYVIFVVSLLLWSKFMSAFFSFYSTFAFLFLSSFIFVCLFGAICDCLTNFSIWQNLIAYSQLFIVVVFVVVVMVSWCCRYWYNIFQISTDQIDSHRLRMRKRDKRVK